MFFYCLIDNLNKISEVAFFLIPNTESFDFKFFNVLNTAFPDKHLKKSKFTCHDKDSVWGRAFTWLQLDQLWL